jgi:hypothetical protein
MRLDKQLEGINEAVEQRLKEQTGDEGLLLGVRAIIFGERTRPMPELPAIWSFGGRATVDHTTMGRGEQWLYPVILASLVKATDPVKGQSEASRLAALAMQCLLGHNRKLGLSYVMDVVASDYQPSDSRNRDDKKQLYWSSATVNVRFRRIDR